MFITRHTFASFVATIALLLAWVPDSHAQWDQTSLPDLTKLAGELIANDSQQDLATLISHVEQRLQSELAAGNPAWREWQRLAAVISPKMAEAQQTAWVTAIRTHVHREPWYASATWTHLTDVQGLLAALADPQQLQLPVAWMAAHPHWRNMGTSGMVQLATRLNAAGPDGTASAREVAGEVQNKWMGDAGTVRTVSISSWERLTRSLSAHMTADMKQQWIAALRGGFASPEELANSDEDQIKRLTNSLRHLGDQQTAQIARQWASGYEGSWDVSKSDDRANLLRTARALASTGPDGAIGRSNMATFLKSEVIGDVNKVKHIPPADWAVLIDTVGEAFSGDDKTQLINQLRAAYATPQSLSQLPLTHVDGLMATMTKLEDTNAKALLAAWVVSNSSWKEASGGFFSQAMHTLAELGESGRPARQAIAEHVRDLLGDASALNTFGIKNLAKVVRLLDSDLSAEDRTLWVRELRRTYHEQPALTELNLELAIDVVGTLNQLGDRTSDGVLASYLLNSSEWRNSDELKHYFAAMRILNATNETATQARDRMRRFIEVRYIDDPQRLALESVVTASQLAMLASQAEESVRQKWAAALMASHAASAEQLQAYSQSNRHRFMVAMSKLDPDHASQIAALSLADAQSISNLTYYQQLTLVLQAIRGSEVTAEQRRARLLALEQDWLARSAQQPIDTYAAIRMSHAWDWAGDREKLREWVERAYAIGLGSEQARASINMRDVAGLAEGLFAAGLTRDNRDYPELAAAIVRLAQENQLQYEDHPAHLGQATRGDQATRILRDGLVENQDRVRLTLAAILAWSYRARGELSEWLVVLDGLIAQAVGGDSKAYWMISKSYAVEIQPQIPNALRRRALINGALAVAESQTAKLAVVRQLVDHYVSVDRPDLALSLIESVEGQFQTTDETRLAMLVLRQAVRDQQADREIRLAQRKVEQAASAQQIALTHLEQALQRAEAANDAEAAGRIQSEIQAIRSTMP